MSPAGCRLWQRRTDGSLHIAHSQPLLALHHTLGPNVLKFSTLKCDPPTLKFWPIVKNVKNLVLFCGRTT